MPTAQKEASVHALFAVEAPAPGGKVSAPFEILKAGEYVRSGGRQVKVTEANLDQAVSNFNHWREIGQDVPVDYDHSFASGGESRAAGWYRSLERRGKSLFASVEWNPKAADAIREGEYRFFSAEFHHDWTNETGTKEGFTILSGGLTNRPFLRGMTPVALHQDVADAVFQALQGNPPASDETRIVSETETPKPTETPEPTAPPAPETPPVPETPPAEAASAETEDAVTFSRDEADKMQAAVAKVETLSTAVETLSSELRAERFNADFGQALHEGRVDAKDETREKWEKRYEKFGREDAKALLDELPTHIPVDERGTASDGVATASSDSDADPAANTFHARADKLAKEKDIPYGDAVSQLVEQGVDY